MILSTLLRLIVISLAFVVAVLVALIVLFSLGIFWAGEGFREAAGGEPTLTMLAEPLGAFFFIAAVAPVLTALPGLVAVLVGEMLGLRSWIYYVLAGGAALAVIPIFAGGEQAGPPAAGYMTIFATAGFAAGFTYWLFAGRKA